MRLSNLIAWTSSLLFCLVLHAQENLTSDNVTVVFPERLRTQASTALSLYLDAARRVRSLTDLPDPGRVIIDLADSDVAYRETYRRLGGGNPPEHALAIAFSPQNVILVRSSELASLGRGSLPETLVHETFHLYLNAALRRAGVTVPLWFNEGAAQSIAGQKTDAGIVNILQTDARSGQLQPLAAIADRFPEEATASAFAYAQSLSFVSWLDERKPGCLRQILASLMEGTSFSAALEKGAAGSLDKLEALWRAKLAGEYSFLRTFLSQLTLFSVLSIVALAAFVRYLVKRKKLRRKLEEEDRLDGY
jgi:hypothetical protein